MKYTGYNSVTPFGGTMPTDNQAKFFAMQLNKVVRACHAHVTNGYRCDELAKYYIPEIGYRVCNTHLPDFLYWAARDIDAIHVVLYDTKSMYKAL